MEKRKPGRPRKIVVSARIEDPALVTTVEKYAKNVETPVAAEEAKTPDQRHRPGRPRKVVEGKPHDNQKREESAAPHIFVESSRKPGHVKNPAQTPNFSRPSRSFYHKRSYVAKVYNRRNT